MCGGVMDLPEDCVDGHHDAADTEDQESAVGDAVEHDGSDSGNHAVECPLTHQRRCHSQRTDMVGL